MQDFISENNFGLTETWLGTDTNETVIIIYSISLEDRRGGGVAFVYKENIRVINCHQDVFSSFELLECICKFENAVTRMGVIYIVLQS